MVVDIIICLVIIFAVLNILFAKSKLYLQDDQQFDKYRKIKKNVQVLVFGSGPGMFDIDFGETDCTKENLCIWPEDFRYDLKMLKLLKERVNKGTKIIHIISPLSFAKNIYVFDEAYNEKYLTVLPTKEVELPKLDRFMILYFPIIKHPKRFVKWIFGKEKVVDKKSIVSEINISEKQRAADEMLAGWLKTNPGLINFENSKQLNSFEEAFERNIRDLSNMKKYCDEQGYQYIPVIPPMSRYLKSHFSDSFLDEVLYTNIERAGIGVECIDYLQDDRFDDMDMYLNGLFLDKYGSIKLTKDLMSRI